MLDTCLLWNYSDKHLLQHNNFVCCLCHMVLELVYNAYVLSVSIFLYDCTELKYNASYCCDSDLPSQQLRYHVG